MGIFNQLHRPARQPREKPRPVSGTGNLCLPVITTLGVKLCPVWHAISCPPCVAGPAFPVWGVSIKGNLSPHFALGGRARIRDLRCDSRLLSYPLPFPRVYPAPVLPVRSDLDRRRISQFRSPDGGPAFQRCRISSLRADGNAFFPSVRIHLSSNAIKVEALFFFGFSC